jgi:hypothetical protein
MTMHACAQQDPQLDDIHRLVVEQGHPRHVLFLVVGEGRFFPTGGEMSTGYALVPSGDVFSFTYDWDSDLQAPAFTEWQGVQPEPHWRTFGEYVDALYVATAIRVSSRPRMYRASPGRVNHP